MCPSSHNRRRSILATIVQLDPIWVNFTASERDVLQVRAALASRGETTASLIGIPVDVGLQTEDGYPHAGKLDYVAPTVNASTGTLAGRAGAHCLAAPGAEVASAGYRTRQRSRRALRAGR